MLTLHGSQFKDAALIVASPPCQEYSYRAMPWKRAKALPPPDNTLFEACFRIQREAEEAAGHHIPLVVENVCGTQKWVGRAKYHFGSFYLWGDVPALMPFTRGRLKAAVTHRSDDRPFLDFRKNPVHEGVKQHGSGAAWFDNGLCREGSKSSARKAASAHIAKIPLPLARWIARAWKPTEAVV